MKDVSKPDILRAAAMLQKIQYAVWMMEPVMDLILVAILYRKKLIRDYCFFFTYLVFEMLHFIVGFTAYHISYSVYFWTFWPLESVEALFGLGVIQEIYSHAFQPFDRLKHFSQRFFKWSVVLLLALAVLVALVNGGTERNRFIAGLLILGRSTGLVKCGLLLLIFAIKQAAGLHWRRLNAAIALGMAIASASYAIGLTVRAYSTHAHDPVISLSITVAYDVALVVWLVGLLSVESELAPTEIPSGLLNKWNSALQETIR